MANVLEVKLTGFQELARVLQQLPDNIVKHVVEVGTRAAGRVVRDAIKAKAPALDFPKKHGTDVVPPGFLKENVRVGVLFRRSAGRGNVGVRVGLTQRAFYGLDVEEGHRVGKRGKRLPRKGSLLAKVRDKEFGTQMVPAHPFMRPAWEESGNSALDAMAKGCQEQLNKLDLSNGVSGAEQQLLSVVGQMLGEDGDSE